MYELLINISPVLASVSTIPLPDNKFSDHVLANIYLDCKCSLS
nr:MAG TPA: hypothetical protein [Bacteriophage sp.]